MKHLVTLLAVVFLAGMAAETVSAAMLVPEKKGNIDVQVLNDEAFIIAVIIDPPENRELEDYFVDGGADLFQRDGGQFVNGGNVATFEIKKGNHRIVVATDVGDRLRVKDFPTRDGSSLIRFIVESRGPFDPLLIRGPFYGGGGAG